MVQIQQLKEFYYIYNLDLMLDIIKAWETHV